MYTYMPVQFLLFCRPFCSYKAVADGIEDGMVCNFERHCEREVGWEEQRLVVGISIQVGGLV